MAAITDALGAVLEHWKLIITTIILSRYLRRFFFHPLKHVPGPWFAAMTNLHQWYCYQSGKEHLIRQAMHEKYGPVVRVAPDLVEISDSKFLPVVYHKHVSRAEVHDSDLTANKLSVINAYDYKEHAHRKRKVAHAFSMTNVRKMEDHVNEHVLRLVKQLDSFSGEIFDYAPWAQYFAYDVVSDVAFGKAFGFLPTGTDVYNLISSFIAILPYVGIIAKLPTVQSFMQWKIIKPLLVPKPEQKFGTGVIMGYRDRLIEERLKDPHSSGRSDFLNLFLQAKNEDGTPMMSIDTLKAELITIMQAGSDTTSTVMRELVQFLQADPEICREVVAEIDAAFDDGRLSSPVPTYDEVSSLPLVSAVIKETLRLGGALSIAIPRETMSPGFECHGVFIPPGTAVGINQYIAHRNEDLYGHDASVFRPSRWLESEERRKEYERYDAAWGYGSRTCLGKNLALLELYKSFVVMFRLFDVEKEGPPKGLTYNREKMNYGIVAQRGIWVRAKRRHVREWQKLDEVRL